LSAVLISLINSGMVINEVFQTAGRTMGDAAFVIYSMATGKFKQAADAMVKSSEDTNEAWADLSVKLQKNWDVLAGQVEDGAERTRDSMSGPMFEFTKDMEENMKRIEKLGDGVGNAFGKALDNAALEGMKFKDVMLGLLKDIEAAIFKTLISNRIAEAISGGITSFFTPAGAGAGAGTTKTVSVTAASRHGNAFNYGNVVPFASGGVIGGPVSWPMSGGRRGLAGEAGQEVIAPLFRTNSGDMGVKSVAPKVEVNVYAPEGSRVSQERKMDGDREQINIMIDEAVAGNIGRPGSKTNRSLRNTFGVSQALTGR
jgi:phage-related minor tail protein